MCSASVGSGPLAALFLWRMRCVFLVALDHPAKAATVAVAIVVASANANAEMVEMLTTPAPMDHSAGKLVEARSFLKVIPRWHAKAHRLPPASDRVRAVLHRRTCDGRGSVVRYAVCTTTPTRCASNERGAGKRCSGCSGVSVMVLTRNHPRSGLVHSLGQTPPDNEIEPTAKRFAAAAQNRDDGTRRCNVPCIQNQLHDVALCQSRS